MIQSDKSVGTLATLNTSQIDELFALLKQQGFDLVGPTVRDNAIIYDHIECLNDLPVGWGDEQDAGKYGLVRRGDGALFGYVVGPHSWKKFLHPPILSLWKVIRENSKYTIEPNSEEPRKHAFIGVRSCELHAISIQDRVFSDGDYIDPSYKDRRAKIFIVAVNCAVTGGTCFCASMQTGPRTTSGFDIALTEIIEAEQHYFVAEVGTERGQQLLDNIGAERANEEQLQKNEALMREATQRMGRQIDTRGIKELLYRNDANPRWDNAAARCLTCANCTMVCPTCFCVTVNDYTDLTGTTAERVRRWDSCFNIDYSYIHCGSVRTSAKARYRQWMTHKLASWIDQFGTSGCVGCGRCITWCPVGIDITEEAAAIRASDIGKKAMSLKES